MKVVFYLSKNKRPHDGISKVLIEIVKRLKNSDENEYFGATYLSKEESEEKAREYLSRYFGNLEPVFEKTDYSAEKLSKLCEFKMPKKYGGLYGNGADCHVFFNNFIPFNKIEGKKIAVVHDLSLLETGKNFIKKFLYRLRLKHTVKVADVISAVSLKTKEELLKAFPKIGEKITVIYNGVSCAEFEKEFTEEQKQSVKLKYGLKKDYMLFVGQPRENKNLPNIIRAYAALNQSLRQKYSLVLANHNEELKRLTEELDLKDDVILLNGIDDEDLVCVFKAARAGLLVSVKEGFGLPLVEGMAAGVPMLTSNTSCMPEIAEDAALYADPFSVQSIAEGMQRILTDDGLRKELIDKGIKRAKEFSWESCAENYERIF